MIDGLSPKSVRQASTKRTCVGMAKVDMLRERALQTAAGFNDSTSLIPCSISCTDQQVSADPRPVTRRQSGGMVAEPSGLRAAMKRQKVLIANRGEIAVRIAQTVRTLGMSPVAVYSAVDRDAAHVRACDEAYAIGPAEAAQSYLNMNVIIDVARRAKVAMVHPGYGFLSENPTFATRLREAGLIFIGPPAPAMQVMGNKTGARRAMQKAGVPIVPGSDAALDTTPAGEAHAAQLAAHMGFPVMLKAAAGGGGRGMRVVGEASSLARHARAASSEAASAFGDGSIYMEKVVSEPRHVEIQIFCDAQGNAFFVGERECSMQRRHQKVIEEAPSVLVDAAMRQQMGQVACQAAKAVAYRGAGTVEFFGGWAPQFLFFGDEHAAAGGARGDGDVLWPRLGGRADCRGTRRGTGLEARRLDAARSCY